MSKPWPPPPDLASIKELVRDADVEGLITVHGAPSDEYDGESEALFQSIKDFPTSDLLAPNLLPILNTIWRQSFNVAGDELALRSPALQDLANQIERFFGPQSKPQVRGA